MSNILCPFNSPCVDPANPLSNFSAEAPDPDLFIGYNSWWSGPPFLDSHWSSTGCKTQCVSSISQEDADICAANQQIVCSNNNSSDGNGGNGWDDPTTGNPYRLFQSQDESCLVPCPDGNEFNYVLTAGAITAFNQAQANRVALQIACSRAKFHKLCLSDLSKTTATVGVAYTGTITATGKTVSPLNTIWLNPGGGLPPGINMAFDIGGGTLTLQGTPTTAGVYPFTITCLTPAGDFMTKNYTINVSSVVSADLFYWTLDEPNPGDNRVDKAHALALVPFTGGGFNLPTVTGGLYVNGVQFNNPAPANSDLDSGITGSLKYTHLQGVSMWAWVRVDAAIGSGPLIVPFQVDFYNDAVGTTINGEFKLIIHFHTTSMTGQDQVTSDNIGAGLGFWNPPVGTWTFFAMRFNPATGLISGRVNAGAWVNGTIPLDVVTSPFGEFQFFSSGGGANLMLTVDEIGLARKSLSDAQFDSIYNSGNGVTWPSVATIVS